MTESNGTGLTQQQGVLLTMETQAATNLLRDGSEALRTMTYTSRGADSVYTLLALGVEKLLKLAIGLAGLDETGEWPSKRVRSFSHRIVELDDAVRNLMRASVDRAAQRGYAEQALAALEADTIWPLLRDGLDRYGSGGRYHYLDWVTEQPNYDSPRGYWDSIEREVLAQQPDLLALFASMTPRDFETARRRTNEAILASITLWWNAVYTFWVQGALGADARSMSSAINPNGVLAR